MSWQTYLTVLAISLLLIAGVPLILHLVGKPAAAAKARDWISAYSGLLGILAALIAAVPVFQQLEETRIGADLVRIQILAGGQQALDAERSRVMRFTDLVDAMMEIIRTKDTTQLAARRLVWIQDLTELQVEMESKRDRPAFLISGREGVAAAAKAMLLPLREATDRSERFFNTTLGDPTALLAKALQQYRLGSHQQIEHIHDNIDKLQGNLFDVK